MVIRPTSDLLLFWKKKIACVFSEQMPMAEPLVFLEEWLQDYKLRYKI